MTMDDDAFERLLAEAVEAKMRWAWHTAEEDGNDLLLASWGAYDRAWEQSRMSKTRFSRLYTEACEQAHSVRAARQVFHDPEHEEGR